jgi:hypothetical protein
MAPSDIADHLPLGTYSQICHAAVGRATTYRFRKQQTRALVGTVSETIEDVPMPDAEAAQSTLVELEAIEAKYDTLMQNAEEERLEHERLMKARYDTLMQTAEEERLEHDHIMGRVYTAMKSLDERHDEILQKFQALKVSSEHREEELRTECSQQTNETRALRIRLRQFEERSRPSNESRQQATMSLFFGTQRQAAVVTVLPAVQTPKAV